MIEASDLDRLPGYEIYRDGLDAIRAGDFGSAPALLLSMARTRLGRAGLPIPESPRTVPVHLEFYNQLAHRYPDAHFRYNANLQRLEKFCRAVERMTGGKGDQLQHPGES
jgi:hypothetical protein